MQVVSKIDHLMTELTKLKPTLSDDPTSNEIRFSNLLTSILENDHTIGVNEIDALLDENAKLENEIPSWVDPDYGYDPQNPRKPNMRELMEAMSGKNVEDLYEDPKENWQKISHQASQMLYAVTNGNEDTRDWLSIMRSSDVLAAAREKTGAMYEPEVDIQTNYTGDQTAVIKDNKGNILRTLSNDITSAEETLLNFGATNESIPSNLEERINPEKFDADLLAFLKNFDNNPRSVRQIVVQSASDAISNKISQEIPLDELAKL